MAEPDPDNVSIRLEGNPLPEEVREYLGSLRPEGIFPSARYPTQSRT